jgi:hypothetical protein
MRPRIVINELGSQSSRRISPFSILIAVFGVLAFGFMVVGMLWNPNLL